jgi:hypothetical protein
LLLEKIDDGADMPTFVRFETPNQCRSSHQPLGLFWAVSGIEARAELPAWVRQELRNSLDWFNDNLPVPRFEDPDLKAIFWFRPHSPVVREMWQLVAILREEDVPVTMRYTRMPGHIVYHDEYQIAAVPYGSGRRRAKNRLAQLLEDL